MACYALLLALFCTCACASAPTQWWTVHFNVTDVGGMHKLQDYRGAYLDIHLSVEPQWTANAIRAYTEEERLWVVECAKGKRCQPERYGVVAKAGDGWMVVVQPPMVPPPDVPGTQHMSVAPYTVRMPKRRTAFRRWKDDHPEVTNPEVDALIRAMDINRIETLVKELSYNFNSRNSYSPEWPAIEQYFRNIFNQFESGWYFETVTFRNDMGPVLVATLEGQNPNQWVVLGAHLDSRGTDSRSPTQRAPGSDDNGSGSAALLHIAEVIDSKFNPATFRYTLKLAWFCGEEQGLVGSRYLAQQWKNENRDIIGMVNGDMIAYSPGQYAGIGAYMNRFSSPLLNTFLVDVSDDYNEAIMSGLTGTFKMEPTNACCSDQQSFHENGFQAAGVFETPTNAVIYPCYHRSTDLPDCFSPPDDYTPTTKVARMFMAASMELALTEQQQ